MATAIYRGSTDVQLQKQTFSWDSTRGGDYAEVWEALDPAKAATFYNGKVYTCRSAQLSIANGVAEMELKWGASAVGQAAANSLEITIDRWECPEPIVEKPVFDHPTFRAYFDVSLAYFGLPLTDDQRAYSIGVWRKGAAAGQDFRTFLSSLPGATTATWAEFVSSNPTAAGYLARIYQFAANDQTHYSASQYSVRHTTNAPDYWSLNRADQNVNRIYSPSSFISEVTNSALWYFPMPGRIQYKISAAVANLLAVTPARDNFLTGWLKTGSAETSIHGGRTEIQTNYLLDQWSTDIYGIAT